MAIETLAARPSRVKQAPRRRQVLRTGSGSIRLVRGTLWFHGTDMAWRRMQDLHRRAIGWDRGIQLTTTARLTRRKAATVFHHAVTCFLGHYVASHDRERLSLFSSALGFIEAGWSFDGLESVFFSGMHTARSLGRAHLVRRGEILWRRIGPPREIGGGFHAAPVYNSATNTIRFIDARVEPLPSARRRDRGRGNILALQPRFFRRSEKADGTESSDSGDSKAVQEEQRQREWSWVSAIVGKAGSIAATLAAKHASFVTTGTWLQVGDAYVSANAQQEHERLVSEAIDAFGAFVAQVLVQPAVLQALSEMGILDDIEKLTAVAHEMKGRLDQMREDITGEILSGVEDVWSMMGDRFSEALGGLRGGFESFMNDIGDFYGSEFNTSMNNARDALDSFNSFLNGLGDAAGGFGNELAGVIGDAFGAMGDAAGSAFGAMGDAAGSAIGFVLGAIGADDDEDTGSNSGTTDDTEDDTEDEPADEPEDDEPEDEPDEEEVPTDDTEVPPSGDDGYPNPMDDDPYGGGEGNPYASQYIVIGDGLRSLVTYSDGEFGCGNVPRIGPGGSRVSELGFLSIILELSQRVQSNDSHHTDPSPIADPARGGPVDPSRIDGGRTDPVPAHISPAARAAAVRLLVALLER